MNEEQQIDEKVNEIEIINQICDNAIFLCKHLAKPSRDIIPKNIPHKDIYIYNILICLMKYAQNIENIFLMEPVIVQ